MITTPNEKKNLIKSIFMMKLEALSIFLAILIKKEKKISYNQFSERNKNRIRNYFFEVIC